eukprot:6488720-Amphidinium_carterae.1
MSAGKSAKGDVVSSAWCPCRDIVSDMCGVCDRCGMWCISCDSCRWQCVSCDLHSSSDMRNVGQACTCSVMERMCHDERCNSASNRQYTNARSAVEKVCHDEWCSSAQNGMCVSDLTDKCTALTRRLDIVTCPSVGMVTHKHATWECR